jgi:acetyltransferase-like isoleucine patch superfamily enzyme
MGTPQNLRKSLAKAMGLLYRLYLSRLGVECGDRLLLIGIPFIHARAGSSIKIGSGVRMASSELGNAVGLNHRCIVRTIAQKAIIAIGDGVQMSGATILAREQITIEKNVFIGANCTVVDSDFHPLDPGDRVSMRNNSVLSAPVHLEENVWLGMNVIVLKGVTIGRNTVVGAGSVVTRSLPPNIIAGGNPAKIIRTLEL